MGKYSIKEVETLSGIQAHTLRIWEQRYNFIEPLRTNTNIRYYTDEQLKYILNVSYLKQSGIKISKLASLSEVQIKEEVEKRFNLQIDKHINIHQLYKSMIDFDEQSFEEIINLCFERIGFLNTINDVISPFLENLGVLWRVSSINPAQEHFISNLIRQKIIVAINGLTKLNNPHPKRIILYLPEGEFHELPLLLAYYTLKQQGHNVIYMGASLPLVDLRKSIDFTEPDYLLTIVTISMQDQTMDEYLSMICSSFKHVKTLVGGAQVAYAKYKDPNLIKLSNFNDLNNIASTL